MAFVQDALDEVMASLRQDPRVTFDPSSMQGAVTTFWSAVDWNERWLQGVLLFHVVLLAAVLVFRRNTAFQSGLFVVLTAIVLCAPQLNSIAHKHWKSFATQDYFDDSGIFITFTVSFPLIFILLLQTVILLCTAGSLLVQAKQAEREYKKRVEEGKKKKEKDGEEKGEEGKDKSSDGKKTKRVISPAPSPASSEDGEVHPLPEHTGPRRRKKTPMKSSK